MYLPSFFSNIVHLYLHIPYTQLGSLETSAKPESYSSWVNITLVQ